MEKYLRDARAFLVFAGQRNVTKELVVSYKSELIEKGYSIIETDYPRDLVNYIRQIESCRTELTSLIMQAQGLNTSKYTKETAKDLASTLKDAESISATGCVSLTQIEIAKYNIQMK